MTHKLKEVYLNVHHTYPLEGNLRFELAHGEGDTPERIRMGKKRGKQLFAEVFGEEDRLQLVFFLPKHSAKITMKRFLFNEQGKIVDSFTTNAWGGYYSEPVTVTIVEVDRKNVMIAKLIDGMMHRDFPTPGKLKLHYPIHFYQPRKEIILNIYDDRGCDIWSWDQQRLKQIYDRYQDWLLDYDRQVMDTFYEGVSTNKQKED